MFILYKNGVFFILFHKTQKQCSSFSWLPLYSIIILKCCGDPNLDLLEILKVCLGFAAQCVVSV